MSAIDLWKKIDSFLQKENFLKDHPEVDPGDYNRLRRKIGGWLKKEDSPPPVKIEGKISSKAMGKLTKKAKSAAKGQALEVFSDGASRGNPGEAGLGVAIVLKGGDTLGEFSQYIGEATNNEAEYLAFIMGAKKVAELAPSEVTFKLDSQLVANQLKGVYKVKTAHLQPLHQEARKWLRKLDKYSIQYIPRAQNAQADSLANLGIDTKMT